ncbi:Cell polarity protein [Yarrowia sp. C11]|nr:Cell polarity protein [Yarrowia sp. C11]
MNEITIPDLSSTAQIAIPTSLDTPPVRVDRPVEEKKEKEKKDDSKTPSEYALHILFTQFVRYAERKLNLCISTPDSDPNITDILGEGADPAFDKIIVSLGYIARREPKPVIDSVMFWRKSKSEVAVNSAAAAHTAAASASAVAGHSRQNSRASDMGSSGFGSAQLQEHASSAREAALVADKKSLISIYILCRVLIEVVKQTDTDSLGEDLRDKLEEIVFKQLRTTDPAVLATSHVRHANWNLFAQLLGQMSDTNFVSVTDRFLGDLGRAGEPNTKEKETQLELVIHGMCHLQLKIYPMDQLDESADFLQSLGHFFLRSSLPRIKYAYMDVFNKLLLPVVSVGTVELNHPVWVQGISEIYPRVVSSIPKTSKQGSGGPAIVAATTLLTVSPQEYFAQNWITLLDMIMSRFKEKQSRGHMAVCLARLLWVYVFRCSESLNHTTKRLEGITRQMFPAGSKKGWASLEPAILHPTIQVLRFMGFSNPSYTVDQILYQLMHTQLLQGSASVGLESLCPERLIIGMKAYMFMLYDYEQDQKPPFLTDESLHQVVSSHSYVEGPFHRQKTTLLEEFHDTFSQILGKLFYLCDTYFSTNKEEDVKRSYQLPSAKTPIAVSFHFGANDSTTLNRGAFLDLLCYTIECIPWCPPSNLKFSKLLEMLCRNTLSVAPVSQAASNALKKFVVSGKEGKSVIEVFAKFMFSFEQQNFCSTEFPATATDRFESLLKLYVTLLELWLDAIKSKNDDSVDFNSVWAVVEEVESNGLFFLCSQNRNVRHLALKILRLTVSFDEVLSGVSGSRVISLLDSTSANDLLTKATPPIELNNPEKTRLGKLTSKNKASLAQLSDSDYGVDTSIWLKVFPCFMQQCFVAYPMPVALFRNIVCLRLVQMHDAVVSFAEQQTSGPHSFSLRHPMRNQAEMLIEQWQIYLIVACCTLTLTDDKSTVDSGVPTAASHNRKRSVPRVPASQQKITSAKSVFRMVIPLMTVEHRLIRDSIIAGLSCINVNIYGSLLECLQACVGNWKEERRRLRQLSHHRRTSSEVSNPDTLIIEVTRILRLTAHFIQNDDILKDEWILEFLSSYIKDMKAFLSLPEVQVEWDYQRLRRYFCGFLETVYLGIIKTPNPARWLPFEGRISCFTVIEEWCGHGQHWALSKDREMQMRRVVLGRSRESKDQSMIVASMELERRKLELAALSCMAVLCSGPAVQAVESNGETRAVLAFNITGLMKWIDAILSSPGEQMKRIGTLALRNLLVNNSDQTAITDEAVAHCFQDHEDPVQNHCYFHTLVDVILGDPNYPVKIHQLLVLALFKVGDSDRTTRCLAIKLLTFLERQYFATSVVREFQISICDTTQAVYKKALFDLSTRYAQDHANKAYYVFSELTRYFHNVSPSSRRDILAAVLPWVQALELKLDPSNILCSSSYMVVVNLLEITARFSQVIPHEVQALWIALGNSSQHTGNVDLILDFVMKESIRRRDPMFVECCRQVVVYLSMTTASGQSRIWDTLFSHLSPRSMIPQYPQEDPPYEVDDGLYVADLLQVFPRPSKESGFSHGQLALIFLVDLITCPSEKLQNAIPLLLQVCFVLLDHYHTLVHVQSREMLVHVIQAFVESSPEEEALVELLQSDATLWAYDDMNSDKNGAKTPLKMKELIRQLLELFSTVCPGLQAEWARLSLSWATTCPVRHVACRSFQLFRTLVTDLDQTMLGDMLARLSNTVSDELPDIQGFSMQILMTLHSLTERLDVTQLETSPQLFWATVACLSTVHEAEFSECLAVLQKYLLVVDISRPDVQQKIIAAFPPGWRVASDELSEQGKYAGVGLKRFEAVEDGAVGVERFEGLQKTILVGLKSCNSYQLSLDVLNLLNKVPDSVLVGSGTTRLLFGLLSNLPSFLHALDDSEGPISEDIVSAATQLQVMAADAPEHAGLVRILDSLCKKKFRTKLDFLRQSVQIISNNFFPSEEAHSLVFLLGLLGNKTDWIRRETLDLLRLMLPLVNMARPEFTGIGADLISPLLRLLQTDYAEAALSVLDEAVCISGSQMDKHVLRMSLGNRSMRKEYERYITLFGIPDESGWAIPWPTLSHTLTRHNVNAVFNTCQVTNSSLSSVPSSPAEEFRFHQEDNFYEDDNTSLSRMDSVSVQEEPDGSLSNMWQALDNLDSFFQKTSIQQDGGSRSRASHMHNHSVSATSEMTDTTDHDYVPQLYDKKVSIILNRSLQRTPSSTSFKTTLADSFANTQQSYGQPTSHPSSAGLSPAPSPGFGRHNKQSTLGGSSDFGDFHLVDEPSTGPTSPSVSQGLPSSGSISNFSQHSRNLSYDQGGEILSQNLSPAVSLKSRKASTSNESSFRLESLLRGASLGKKSTKTKTKDSSSHKKKPSVAETPKKEANKWGPFSPTITSSPQQRPFRPAREDASSFQFPPPS